MTRHILWATASAAALLMAIPAAASAQSHDDTSWNGFHVGLGVGADATSVKNHSKARATNNNNNNNNNNGSVFGESFSDLGKVGTFVSVEGGWDHQMDRTVVGAFANYDFGSNSVANTVQASISNGNGNSASGALTTRVRRGDSWAVGGRAGYLTSPKTLIYVDAGLAGTTIKQTVVLSSGKISNGATHSTSRTGYLIGAGIETKLTPKISLKGEFRYVDYGSAHLGVGSTSSGNYDSVDSKVTDSSVRAVLSYRF